MLYQEYLHRHFFEEQDTPHKVLGLTLVEESPQYCKVLYLLLKLAYKHNCIIHSLFRGGSAIGDHLVPFVIANAFQLNLIIYAHAVHY